MINIENFKKYCDFFFPSLPATKSRGIVTASRADSQSTNLINIPVNTIFSVTTGQSFKTLESAELKQSQTFIPLLLESLETGPDGNIPTGQSWNTPITGLVITNPQQAFSGGKDATPGHNENSVVNRFNVPDDDTLQLCLNLGQKICLNIIGKTDAPDTDTFKAGVFFAGRYFLETRSKQGFQIENGIIDDVIQERKVTPGIDDLKVHQGVMRILTGILASDRSPKAFMPAVDNGSS